MKKKSIIILSLIGTIFSFFFIVICIIGAKSETYSLYDEVSAKATQIENFSTITEKEAIELKKEYGENYNINFTNVIKINVKITNRTGYPIMVTPEKFYDDDFAILSDSDDVQLPSEDMYWSLFAGASGVFSLEVYTCNDLTKQDIIEKINSKQLNYVYLTQKGEKSRVEIKWGNTGDG